ncbi:MAG: S8 family serine peptidase, partial [Gemmatimonadaceae bacterium]|nr:S8 family serine peptidase [Gemmatimonadaceae bacterium]
MHCSTILLALGLTLLGLPAGWAQDDTPEVTVPDASLRAVLEDSLGLSAGDPITASSLAKLTTLEAADLGIVDLTGLEHATGLSRLHLGPRREQLPWSNSNAVSDLSPLSGLTALTWLHLAGNSVADVTPLSGLTGLTFLNLQVNEVAEVSSLSGLTDLADLFLAFNPLRDASSLSGLTGLSVHDLPRPLQYPKLGSSLNSRVEGYQAPSSEGGSAVRGQGGQESTPTVPVRIRTNSRDSVDTVARFLQGRGIASNTWRSDGRDGVQGLLWARVPVSLLVRLSEQPAVIRVREVLEAIPQQSQSQEPPTTVSSAHGATAWRNAGIRGQGIKVGVLDIGFHDFGGLMELLEELNPSYHTYCYADEDDTVADSTGLGDCGDDPHGTDVTRALLDIAPNVELYIARAYKMGPSQRTNALAWMIRQGVQVINFSVNDAWDGPGDGTSTDVASPLQLVDTAVGAGIAWVNAAGNDAQRTWYSDSPTFDTQGYLVLPGTPPVRLPVNLTGQEHEFQLRWKDDWSNPAINLDLYLYTVSETGIRLAWSSTDPQPGPDAVPMEILVDDVVPFIYGGARDYWLSVRKLSASAPDWVQLQEYSGLSNAWQDATLSGSIGNPAESANAGMLAVGAADVSGGTAAIEDYSARGPVPELEDRIKPDLVGGLESDESGTSIAAPRVAGLAALVIQELGDIYTTPAQVAQYLRDNADQPTTDLSDPNNTWGHGFAKLPPPVAAPKEGSAHASAEGIEVRWKAVPAAAGYRLEFQRQLVRGTSGWSEYAWLATLANESLPSADMRVTFQHTPSTERHPLDGDYRYRYRVRSLPAGAWSTDIPVGPSAPRSFKAEAGDGQVLLTWAAPATTGGSPLLGYHYREIVPGDTTAWFDFLKGWTRYLPQELSNGVAHTFEVRAYTKAGSGASVDTTVTPAGAPRAPG